MPVSALHSSPVTVGAGRRSARRQARFSFRGSSLEASAAAVTTVTVNGSAAAGNAVETKEKVQEKQESGLDVLYDDGFGSMTVKDYFATVKVLCSRDDGGPPRWFSPVECGRPAVDDAPLLLFLPGMDGVGTGLILHHKSLGKVFEVRCFHIPVNDRTPFEDRPIYLVGDSFGGSLALAVAARNPQIDLVLIIVNPGTSFGRSPLQPVLHLLESMPREFHVTVPCLLSFVIGDPLKMAAVSIENNLSPQETLQKLSDTLTSMLRLLSKLSDVIPKDTLFWKLELLKAGAAYANSRLHSVKADVLLLASGNDNFLPSGEEADRLFKTLKNCRVRYFKDNGHTLLLEDGVNLLTVIKGANMYRRGRKRDFVTDYLPPTLSEFKKTFDVDHKLFHLAMSPVVMSTHKNGKIVRGLAGVPDKGPVLFVGNHALMGIELSPLYEEFLREKKTIVRGLTHPFLFGKLFESSRLEISPSNSISIYGGLPVTPINMYRLFERNEFVLLYPGGVREVLHRKGEEYKLFWPDQPEFVRMATRFNATIIPFGCVGEDDVLELVLDYNDQKNIPGLREWIESINNNEDDRVRNIVKGTDGNQDMYLPVLLPKVPGRLYCLFGQPIELRGMDSLVRDRKRANEAYLRIKSDVEIMS